MSSIYQSLEKLTPFCSTLRNGVSLISLGNIYLLRDIRLKSILLEVFNRVKVLSFGIFVQLLLEFNIFHYILIGLHSPRPSNGPLSTCGFLLLLIHILAQDVHIKLLGYFGLSTGCGLLLSILRYPLRKVISLIVIFIPYN